MKTITSGAVIVCALLTAGCVSARDEQSYRAGHAVGVNYGTSRIQSEGRYGASDAEIREDCSALARNAAELEVSAYGTTGQIKGRDVDVDDYRDGCVDGARSTMSRR